jgi:N-carbamoyl-L-amino-acid hydrolase
MRLGTRSVPQMDRHAEGSARGACHSGIRYWDVRCGLAGVDSLGGGTRSPPASAQRIDADLVDLARIADDSLPGFTRQALTPFDEEGRESTLRKMRDAGLTAQIDAAGNVIGVLDGTHPEAGLLMTGSHTNTVESGGRFDGNVGVAAALEVVRTLRATATFLRHTLMVLVFFNEEPNRFGQSCVGSHALVGGTRSLRPRDPRRRGRLVRRSTHRSQPRSSPGPQRTHGHLSSSRVRGAPCRTGSSPCGSGQSDGLVTTITGLSRFRALFRGQADHAGTRPMEHRHDAGRAAAGTVLAVEAIVSRHPDGRAPPAW